MLVGAVGQHRAVANISVQAPGSPYPTAELQWLRHEATRCTAASLAHGELLRRHLEERLWPYLRQAARVPQDFPTISEAIARAPEWQPSTILVAPGSYCEMLFIDKPVTIIGHMAGLRDQPAKETERAVLTLADGMNPINFVCDGSPQIRGFCVSSKSSCVSIAAGRAHVAHCRVTSWSACGVMASGSACVELAGCHFTGNRKAGVIFADSASGVLRFNRFEGNQGVGILLRGCAQPTIENNTFVGTKLAAVMVSDSAFGALRANSFESNEGSALVIRGDSQTLVEDNTFKFHTSPAILIKDRSRATVRSNVLENNMGLGIVVSDCATPIIECNELKANRKAGLGTWAARRQADALRSVSESGSTKGSKRAAIALQDSSAAVVRGNHLADNDGYGILVCHSAHPVVEGNDLRRHWRPAVAIRDDVTCAVRRNKLVDNEGHGIIVCGAARPTLEDNEIIGQKQPAIWVSGAAGGLVQGNHLRHSTSYGIVVCGSANPVVRDNELVGHELAAISVQDIATGFFSGNRLSRNSSVGILVRDAAAPTIQDNTVFGACPPHIIIQDRARGTLRGNSLARVGSASALSTRAPLVALLGAARLEAGEQSGVVDMRHHPGVKTISAKRILQDITNEGLKKDDDVGRAKSGVGGLSQVVCVAHGATVGVAGGAVLRKCAKCTRID